MAKKESRDVPVVESKKSLIPFDDMERWFEDFFRRPMDMERWFDDAFRRPFLPPGFRHRLRAELTEISPSVDIYEEGDSVIVKAEVPGMEKEHLDIRLTGDTLTISGEKKTEEKVEKKDFYRIERSSGSFSRSLRLPAEVQTDKAKASFKNGVLEIILPKTAQAKEKVKKITIE